MEQGGCEVSYRSAEQMLFGLLASLMCAQTRFTFDRLFFFFFVLELMLKRSGKISVEFLGRKADAMNDRMSLGLWWHLQHLVELLGNFTPQCPLKSNTTDTAFRGRTALQDVLLVLASASFGECVICSGLLTTGSTLLPRSGSPAHLDNEPFWKASEGVLWCDILTSSFACVSFWTSWALHVQLFLTRFFSPGLSHLKFTWTKVTFL